ncbi:phosphopyruvate hydratase [Marinifilum sp. N1E240]|uniref:phosphopyruvate hydratase n=1 Tax=Marinifilum sp. N1E240 TaxID=2608082 RepID=UPI00128BA53B|nr:phosphopyruvate hydratase [Marinifilum sp. N1E240]MPQ47130.1 phosphopyruvate hydratase [Marinifilum sp. N1E240]
MMIKSIKAQEVLDSRGNPTVETEITLTSGAKGRAIVPSGASTGEREAAELRDGDKTRFFGKGVLKAVANVNSDIADALCGKKINDQRELDTIMINLDGTPNKSKLGANAILSVSLAYAKACANKKEEALFQHLAQQDKYVLPVPCMNVINGGVHADNNIDFQEFMIAPHNAPNFETAIRMGIETFHSLKKVLQAKGYNTAVGDEGGFAPNLKSNEEAIEVILEAITAAGYVPGKDISICLDPASSEMWKENKYHFFKSDGSYKSSEEMVAIWEDWINKYPIVLLEDGMAENDWKGWQILTEKLGDKVELVGDDIFCTNAKILQEGIDKKVANSILIKLNQIGTLSETIDTMKLAKDNGYNCFVSHRSGETEDTTIADFTVALGAGHLKTGSGCRSERISKFNQLLRIERILGDKAEFAGIKTFKNQYVC